MRMLVLFIVAALSAAAGQAAETDVKTRLTPLQEFIGEWKGQGQRERGKTEGGWIESTSWAWKFADGEAAAIAFKSGDAKYLPAGALTPGENEGEYQLEITAGDQRVLYRGKLEEGKLVLTAAEPVEGLPARISLRLVAEGKRLIALYEVKSAASDRFVRLAEVGYTRVGSGFGKGSQGPECLVTGGFGSIEVSYEGKKYFVCCTGCKDYFDEDPKRAVEEYLERKLAEKEKGKN